MADVLKPSVALLAKVASILVHVDEGLGAGGHQFDWSATSALMLDPEIHEWLSGMGKMALIPVRREAKRKAQP